MKNIVKLLRELLRIGRFMGIKFQIKYVYFLIKNSHEILKTKTLGIVDKQIKGDIVIKGKRFDSEALPTLREIILINCYGIMVGEKYPVVVDLGANMGVVGSFIGENCGKYIAVEVNPEFKTIFEKHMKWNGIKNYILVNKFASNVDDGNNISINKLINDFNLPVIDFLKIDIEGSERYLFDSNLEWLDSVKFLTMEVHPCFGVDVEKICLLLKEKGFKTRLYDKELKPKVNLTLDKMGYIRAVRKKYLFVTTHFAPNYHYGGVVESSTRLFKYLSKLGNFRVVAVSKNPSKFYEYNGNIGHCYKSIFFHRFGFSLDAIWGLYKDINSSDILFINGIFTLPVTIAAFYASLLNKPFIVSVRGGLEPWSVAHKRWKKFLYIKFITFPLIRRAKYIHVTSQTEKENIERLGFSNTFLVTNGIDRETFSKLPDKYDYQDGSLGNRFIFLLLSRIDKEKGIDILVEAYKRFSLKNSREKHLLLLVGPDHQGYLKSLNVDFASNNIKYLPGVYGKDKIKLIRRSDVIVLPSYSENFGNLVAEALACERPVITTTGTPWNEIENVGCGFYIKPDVEELYYAMQKIYNMSEAERNLMGKRGRHYIFENFDWAEKAEEFYRVIKKL